MATSATPPDFSRIVSRILTRVDALERRLNDAIRNLPPLEVIFTLDGELTVDESEAWPPPVACRLFQVVATLREAGSTATVATLEQNGATIATITFPAGVTVFQSSPSALLAANQDLLVCRVTTAGTDATKLLVAARFKVII